MTTLFGDHACSTRPRPLTAALQPGLLERVLVALAMLLIVPGVAWAYLDPGVGSMLIQGLIATLAAVGYGIRVYWKRLRSLGRAQDSGSPDDERTPR